jgi:hypothetical protein
MHWSFCFPHSIAFREFPCLFLASPPRRPACAAASAARSASVLAAHTRSCARAGCSPWLRLRQLLLPAWPPHPMPMAAPSAASPRAEAALRPLPSTCDAVDCTELQCQGRVSPPSGSPAATAEVRPQRHPCPGLHAGGESSPCLAAPLLLRTRRARLPATLLRPSLLRPVVEQREDGGSFTRCARSSSVEPCCAVRHASTFLRVMRGAAQRTVGFKASLSGSIIDTVT